MSLIHAHISEAVWSHLYGWGSVPSLYYWCYNEASSVSLPSCLLLDERHSADPPAVLCGSDGLLECLLVPAMETLVERNHNRFLNSLARKQNKPEYSTQSDFSVNGMEAKPKISWLPWTWTMTHRTRYHQFGTGGSTVRHSAFSCMINGLLGCILFVKKI